MDTRLLKEHLKLRAYLALALFLWTPCAMGIYAWLRPAKVVEVEVVKEVPAEPQVIYVVQQESEEDRITRLAVQMRLVARNRARELSQ